MTEEAYKLLLTCFLHYYNISFLFLIIIIYTSMYTNIFKYINNKKKKFI